MDKGKAFYDAAFSLFSERGYKDVSISDIAKRAGFATGTLYSFYESKEDLFIQIYAEVQAASKRELLQSLEETVSDPEEFTRGFFAGVRAQIQQSKILGAWYSDAPIARKLRSWYEEHPGDMAFVRDSVVRLIARWQQEKRIRQDIRIEDILGIIEIVQYLEYHWQDIEAGNYPDVMEAMIRLIVSGLSHTQI